MLLRTRRAPGCHRLELSLYDDAFYLHTHTIACFSLCHPYAPDPQILEQLLLFLIHTHTDCDSLEVGSARDP